MNKPQIHLHPVEVQSRLEQLGIPRAGLFEVIERAVSARRNATPNHPPGSGGWMAWSEGTCRLREEFLPLGWDKNEESRISSVSKGSVRIALCNTDDGTGLPSALPMNRSKKGAGTDYIVSANQGVFEALWEEASNVIQIPAAAGGTVYWYLCVYCEGETVRAELACPSECENGYFKGLQERIILIGADEDDGGGVRSRPDVTGAGPDFEILVTRKQA